MKNKQLNINKLQVIIKIYYILRFFHFNIFNIFLVHFLIYEVFF